MIKLFRTILFLFLFVGSVYADTAKQVDFLLAGYRTPTTDVVLAGGKVYTYLDGTSTLSALWTDKDQGGSAANPIILDSSGKTEVYGANIYKFEIYDSLDNPIEIINGLEYKSIFTPDANGIGSIDDLRDISETPTDGQVVEILGYYTEGDGGGGSFYWDAASVLTDDSGLVIKVTSITTGRWIRLYNIEIYAVWFGLSSSLTGAQNLTILNQIITSIPAGTTVIMPDGTYDVLGQWDISKSCKIIGTTCELDFTTDTTDQGILITVSDVEIDGLSVTGPQRTTNVGTQQGIFAYGTNNSPAAPTYISKINITNCTISNWGFRGIMGRYVENFKWNNNTISECAWAGIVGQSVKNGTINGNIVFDIDGSGSNAYGIATSRNAGAGEDLTSQPASADVSISYNVVSDIPIWEGIDTHAGVRHTIIGNTVTDCLYGIAIVGSNDDGIKRIARDIALGNNNITTTVVGAVYGYNIGGETGQPLINVSLTGGTVKGFSYGVRATFTEDLNISGINSVGNYINSIYLQGGENENFNVTGNTLGNMVSDASNDAPVWVDTAGDVGSINNNMINAINCDYGIRYSFADYSQIRQKDNVVTNYAITPYFRNDRIDYGRWYDNSDYSTVGAGIDTFLVLLVRQNSFIIPGQVLKYSASGIMTDGNTENKTLFFLWGGTSYTVSNIEAGADDWRIEVEVTCTAAATQRISWVCYRDNVVQGVGYEDATEDVSAGNVNAGFRGECATGTDIITQKTMSVTRLMDY